MYPRTEDRCRRCIAEADAYYEQAEHFDEVGAFDSGDLALTFAGLWEQIAELHTQGAGIRRDGGSGG